jgi:UPF0716 protein FxsA
MLLRLLLLFILVPLIEVALLIQIGDWMGVLPTIGLVIFTGVVGAALARREGLRTWRAIQAELAAGRLPGDRMVDGLLILLAGAVLVTPGVLTDTIGFLLLVPPVRARVRTWLKERFRLRYRVVDMSGPPADRREFIDVQATSPQDEKSESG